MTPNDYFDAVKARLNLTSDYALCKRLEISNRTLPAMRRGERAVPVCVMFKIAITLEIDPATVVADLEAQREKSPKRKDFWKGFISRAAVVLTLIVCTLGSNFSGIQGSERGVIGGNRRRWQYA